MGLTPARGRHASPLRRREDARRDLERYRVIEELRREGFSLRSNNDKPSVFEVAARRLAAPLAGAPSTLRHAYWRARRLLSHESEHTIMGSSTEGSGTYSEHMQMQNEHKPTVTLTVRLPVDDLEELRRIAAHQDRSMSSVTRVLIRREIRECRVETPKASSA